MAYLQFQDVARFYGVDTAQVQVVASFNNKVEKGEFIVFPGPSGCGDTTFTRMVGGLEALGFGRIVLGGSGAGPAGSTPLDGISVLFLVPLADG